LKTKQVRPLLLLHEISFREVPLLKLHSTTQTSSWIFDRQKKKEKEEGKKVEMHGREKKTEER